MKTETKIVLSIVGIIILSLLYRSYLVASQNDFTYSYSFNKIENKDATKINQWINGINDDLTYKWNISDSRIKNDTSYIYSRKYNDAEIEFNDKTLSVKLLNSAAKKNEPLLINIKFNPDKVEAIELFPNEQQSIDNSQDLLIHEFESIAKYKSKYMGDASNLANLFYSLPLSDIKMSFQLITDELTAEVNYAESAAVIGKERIDRAIIYNATAAFALIDNLEAVKFNFDGVSYKILRTAVEKWYGVDLFTLAEKDIWKEAVQGKLKDDSYVQSCIRAIIAEAEERTPIEAAIVDYYANTGEPIIIYEQIPFESGTLVLAEKLSDGEHYPDLHFVDASGKVAYLTMGSCCWTLNYTQFKGHYIYFGLAGVETRQYKDNPIAVKKVEALFTDKKESVVPKKEIPLTINALEKDTRLFNNPQGYIIPIKGREIPFDFTAVLENGEKLSLSKRVIENSMGNMPEYLKSKKAEVYNSFAFTYTSMLTPTEWDKGYKEGEIALEGGTDKNGNRNALYLRSAGHMSFIDSFILPQDIKPFYLSDNYPRIAVFKAGETVGVKYPGKRKLLDCRILKLSRQKVEKEIGQDSLVVIGTNEKGQLILPKEKGYYMFVLRTEEDKEIQTYAGMLITN